MKLSKILTADELFKFFNENQGLDTESSREEIDSMKAHYGKDNFTMGEALYWSGY